MRRREQGGSEEWIAEEALAQLSASEQARVELLAPRLSEKYDAILQYEAFARPVSAVNVAQTIRAHFVPGRNVRYYYYIGHYHSVDKIRPNTTEVLRAKVDALQEQADKLREQADELREQVAELKCGLLPATGYGEPKTALGWILSHPELRTRYGGQHVAFTNTSPFRVVAANSNLDDLLDSLGDNLSGLYIHQFA